MKPRLSRVVTGTEDVGITTLTERVPRDGVELPDGMSPQEAADFQSALKKLTDSASEPLVSVELDKELAKVARAAKRDGTSPLEDDETKILLALLRKMAGRAELDVTAAAKSQLNKLTGTHEVITRHWHGGGGFTHLKVGPSMFVEVGGMLLLADWATQTELSKVICAQLSVRYAPDGIFAGMKGRTRYVVIDGMVGDGTIEAILDRLEEGEVVEVWATQIGETASGKLRAARPGSSLHAIPAAVLDSYRRKNAATSPFRRPKSAAATPTGSSNGTSPEPTPQHSREATPGG